MTGLLRTTLFFFLPIFVVLAVYHSWVDSPESAQERQESLRGTYALSLETTRDVCETMVQDGTTGIHPMPPALEDAGIILAEVVSGPARLLRLISEPLAAASDWTLVPDPSKAPTQVSGFRFSVGDRSIQSILFEETVYDTDGNPARLNIFAKEKIASNND